MDKSISDRISALELNISSINTKLGEIVEMVKKVKSEEKMTTKKEAHDKVEQTVESKEETKDTKEETKPEKAIPPKTFFIDNYVKNVNFKNQFISQTEIEEMYKSDDKLSKSKPDVRIKKEAEKVYKMIADDKKGERWILFNEYRNGKVIEQVEQTEIKVKAEESVEKNANTNSCVPVKTNNSLNIPVRAANIIPAIHQND